MSEFHALTAGLDLLDLATQRPPVYRGYTLERRPGGQYAYWRGERPASVPICDGIAEAMGEIDLLEGQP